MSNQSMAASPVSPRSGVGTPPLRKLAGNRRLARAVAGSVIGTIVEWYDYNLYGLSSALIFSKLFFTNLPTAIGIFLSFATFAVGFLIRPIGGAIFGSLGDRIGRKRVLLITLLIMGCATTLIGVVPTFHSIGYWAAIFLIVLRAIQGLGSGSEYAGAVINVAENAPKKWRGFYSSLPYVGVSGGLLLSSGIFALVERLPQSQFLSWGWRIPFLSSVVLIVIGIVLRTRMDETKVFEELKAKQQRVKMPFAKVFRQAPKSLISAWTISMADDSFAYLFQTFLVAYIVSTLGMPAALTVGIVAILGAVQLVTIPLLGALSDRIGRRPVLLGGAITSALFAFPLFWILDTKQVLLVILTMIVASSVFRSAIVAAQASWYTELFDSRIRYTGFAVGREWPSIIGGLMPAFGSGVLIVSHGSTWAISLLIIVFALLAAAGTLLRRDNRHLDLEQIESK